MPAQRRSSRPAPLAVPVNSRLRTGGVGLLAALPEACADLVFFDPQYRGMLDAMRYGNEGARQKGRAALPQMNDGLIESFLREIERVAKPRAHVMLWVDKFSVASARHLIWMRAVENLAIVDLFAWNKGRIGMGRRARCSTEYCVVLQKEPTRAKGVWTDNSISDSWTENQDRDLHPHAKPVQLTQRLIRAVTKRGGIVVDPCAGGFGVLEACLLTGRTFVGGDIHTGEVRWPEET